LLLKYQYKVIYLNTKFIDQIYLFEIVLIDKYIQFVVSELDLYPILT